MFHAFRLPPTDDMSFYDNLQVWRQILFYNFCLFVYMKHKALRQSSDVFLLSRVGYLWQQANLSVYILGFVDMPNREILEYSQSINMLVLFLWDRGQTLNRCILHIHRTRKQVAKFNTQSCFVYFSHKILDCQYISIVKTFWISSAQAVL